MPCGRSAETALIEITDDILQLVDVGSAVALVGLDISAAFDTVNHPILLKRLECDFAMCQVSETSTTEVSFNGDDCR